MLHHQWFIIFFSSKLDDSVELLRIVFYSDRNDSLLDKFSF